MLKKQTNSGEREDKDSPKEDIWGFVVYYYFYWLKFLLISISAIFKELILWYV